MGSPRPGYRYANTATSRPAISGSEFSANVLDDVTRRVVLCLHGISHHRVEPCLDLDRALHFLHDEAHGSELFDQLPAVDIIGPLVIAETGIVRNLCLQSGADCTSKGAGGNEGPCEAAGQAPLGQENGFGLLLCHRRGSYPADGSWAAAGPDGRRGPSVTRPGGGAEG